jgi:hypothetical protein
MTAWQDDSMTAWKDSSKCETARIYSVTAVKTLSVTLGAAALGLSNSQAGIVPSEVFVREDFSGREGPDRLQGIQLAFVSCWFVW